MLSHRQEDLRRVLKAYAMYNVKTGYCQVCTQLITWEICSNICF